MSIKKTALDTELQDYLASTQNIKADPNKRVRTLNIILDKLQSLGNWMFTVRLANFVYDSDTEEYGIEDDLGLTDFKDIYTINNVPVIEYRANNFGAESVSIRQKDGKYYLNAYFDADDTYDLEYFSSHMVQKSNVWQSRFTEGGTDEEFIGPIELKPLIVEMAYYELLRKAKNIDKNERIETLNNIIRLQNEAFAKYGYSPKKGATHVKTIR
jgi:hypothetical protein